MRVRGSHMESEKLRKHLAKQAASWGNLQHDLGTLLQVPEAKGQRQQVGRVLSAAAREYDILATAIGWYLIADRSGAPPSGATACVPCCAAVPGLTGKRHELGCPRSNLGVAPPACRPPLQMLN